MRERKEACGKHNEREGAEPEGERKERQEHVGKIAGHVARKHGQRKRDKEADDRREECPRPQSMHRFFGAIRVIEEVEEYAMEREGDTEYGDSADPPGRVEPVEDPGGKTHLGEQRAKAG